MTKGKIMKHILASQRFLLIFLLITGAVLVMILVAPKPSAAQDDRNPVGGRTMHPTFALLDSDGETVLSSQNPVSTMQTCGQCHDTAFIAQNATHNGISIFSGADTPGYGDDLLTYAMTLGKTIQADAVEMNCFLCHTAAPNNEARLEALGAADVDWANSATLLGTGLIEKTNAGWRWNVAAFNDEGHLLPGTISIQDPTSANCGQCHGVVHTDAQSPLTFDTTSLNINHYSTLTTGEVISPQRISNSGLNLANKVSLSRSWDVHAERVLDCTNCHYSLNNPAYYAESGGSRPDHLTFDPRRLDISDYLHRPLHQFAGMEDAGKGALACESCHTIEATHNWLPYKDRHNSVLECQTCHVPQLFSPALQSVDWTILTIEGAPRVTYRGMDSAESKLITGYTPVLLPHLNADGTTSIAPYNLLSSWYWVSGDSAQPVTLDDLKAVYFEGHAYVVDVVQAFDVDQNGVLDDSELLIDTDAKEAFIAARLEANGLGDPRIVGEVQPFVISHNIARGEWATRDCRTCHGEESRLNAALMLSDRIPGGVQPTFVSTSISSVNFVTNDSGALFYRPKPEDADLYIFGHSAVDLVDWFGMLALLGTLAAASLHGGGRYLAMRRSVPHEPEVRRVYMYSVYERQWHWLQTALIFGLIFTGLVIHKPDKFGIFSFDYIVQVHNILAAVLVLNAALAAFYHLASGEIRQFLPRPYGFFNDAFLQAKYYLRGIFKGEEHPFEKTRQRKMNPLQQVTYLMILNVLLPLQVITGVLMWGVQQFSEFATSLGGLPFLAPLHTLVAWMFASFIVAHVYLTTTGHTPLTNIKAMITGWDESETHQTELSEKEQPT